MLLSSFVCLFTRTVPFSQGLLLILLENILVYYTFRHFFQVTELPKIVRNFALVVTDSVEELSKFVFPFMMH